MLSKIIVSFEGSALRTVLFPPYPLVAWLGVLSIGVTSVRTGGGRGRCNWDRGHVIGLISGDSLHNHGLNLLGDNRAWRSMADMGRKRRGNVFSTFVAPA